LNTKVCFVIRGRNCGIISDKERYLIAAIVLLLCADSRTLLHNRLGGSW